MTIETIIQDPSIFVVCGTPENYLTAIRYNTWGFNNLKDFERLREGSYIFFYSNKTSMFLKDPDAGIIGFGQVGEKLGIQNTPLWIDEKLSNKNYPYRFTLSQTYLFADIPIDDSWNSTSFALRDKTQQCIEHLLIPRIPYAALNGLPIRQSFSTIKNPDVVRRLLNTSQELVAYGLDAVRPVNHTPDKLVPITRSSKQFQIRSRLIDVDSYKLKVLKDGTVSIEKDLATLMTAEQQHHEILETLREEFLQAGYQVLESRHVDLFAYNEQVGFLVEAKSLGKANFISQARKGLAQLLDYEYFNIAPFLKENQLSQIAVTKVLAFSEAPQNLEYIAFINSLGIKAVIVNNKKLETVGEAFTWRK